MSDLDAAIEKLQLRTEIEERKALRDEFARAALTGMLAHPQTCASDETCAKYAYKHADAMLKAREG